MSKSRHKSYFADQFKKSVLLLPAVAILLIFFVYPVILTIYYSFTNMALTGSAAKNFQFVGILNYKRLFTDSTARTAILNTLVFLIGSLIGQQLVGFLIAYFMKEAAQMGGPLRAGGLGNAGGGSFPLHACLL